jgi:hypothetical protein
LCVGFFEKDSAEWRSSWDRLKSEPSQPTVKRIRAFLVHLDWLRKQVASTNSLTGIPAVKLQRFAAEARVLNVARMKELTEKKRFALAAELFFRQLARAYDDAADMLIRQVQDSPLQRLWGLGHSASADGMKWNLYPQTLMSEYHIRYGGYGGIGYYLVSDNYIALMSRFTTCGSWEGHYILDFLQENKSNVQPDTIHADTQGQSTAIFGLACLLGIELMPRIRHWKDQHLFRPAPHVLLQAH